MRIPSSAQRAEKANFYRIFHTHIFFSAHNRRKCIYITTYSAINEFKKKKVNAFLSTFSV